MTKPLVSFLGLGAMGAPMAGRLLDGGYELTVFDVAAAAVETMRQRGAKGASSPAEAVRDARIVFACLPNPSISLDVALGRDGIASALREDTIYVEMSTIGSAAIEQIAAGLAPQRCRLIDAPVSGGPRGAHAGTLSIMAAGDPDTFDEAQPALQAITRNIFRVGDKPGLAQIAKLANNMISAAGMASAFEATAMAVKAGVDAEVLIDIVNASTGRNSATMDKFPASVLPRTFDYGGKLETMYKDVALCMEEARRRGVPMWVGSAVHQLWFHAMTQGRAHDDYTTLGLMIEEWAGVTIGRKSSDET